MGAEGTPLCGGRRGVGGDIPTAHTQLVLYPTTAFDLTTGLRYDQGMSTSIPQRVWDRIIKDYPTGCWLWEGATSKGYAKFTYDGTTYRVHRWVYEELIGPADENLHHTCPNRHCVNPAHLSGIGHVAHAVLTGTERWAGHCKHGHEFTPENSYVRKNPDGSFRDRQCRTCRAARRVV